MTDIKEEGETMTYEKIKRAHEYIEEIDRSIPDGTFMVDSQDVKYVMKNGQWVKSE